MEPTCAATCFIHLGLRRRPDNIRLMLPFSTKRYTLGVFYLFFFIYLFILMVSQKRVLYLKTSLSGKAATHSNQQVINKHDSKEKKKKKKASGSYSLMTKMYHQC